ncbi:MAG: DUF1203 domain-containing protein [Sneathiella sp.]
MSDLHYLPISTEKVRALQNGSKDAYGQLPEKHISDGEGLPCRHCLGFIEEGDSFLILSYRPFDTAQAFAEQGPIFLHAAPCDAYSTQDKLPDMYVPEKEILLRGYDKHDRIVYGTGQVVQNKDVAVTAKSILATTRAHYIHARSATNNCFQYRIETAS